MDEERFGKCPFYTTQRLIQGKWAILILHYLSEGPLCFNELQRKMPKMTHATLSNQQVNAFAEDSKGRIWIGTFRGLNRYDGHDYYQYFCTNDSTGLPDNQILDLLNDSQGRLWVATNDGLCLYTEQDGFERIPQPDGDRHCNQLLEDREGNIYVSTGTQILRFDPASSAAASVPIARNVIFSPSFFRINIQADSGFGPPPKITGKLFPTSPFG